MMQEHVRNDPSADRNQQEIAVVAAYPMIAARRLAQTLMVPIAHYVFAATVVGWHAPTPPVPTLMLTTVMHTVILILTLIMIVIVITVVVAVVLRQQRRA
jgi:hypothetical protein